MHMKKKYKVLYIFLILILVLSLSQVVFASTLTPNKIPGNTTGVDTEVVTTAAGKIVGFLQVVGSVVSVAILVVVGIRYMLGSVEEKAEYKKKMMAYVIGAILIFGAVTVASMVYNFATSISESISIDQELYDSGYSAAKALAESSGFTKTEVEQMISQYEALAKTAKANGNNEKYSEYLGKLNYYKELLASF